MTSKSTGPCSVCGVETTQRCSACSKHGFDLFFCSSEHQRMVWFVHKQVCGSKAKPFSFPPLSQDEVKDAVARLRKPYRTSPTTTNNLETGLRLQVKTLPPSWRTVPLPTLIQSLSDASRPLSAPLRLSFESTYHLLNQVRVALRAHNMERFLGAASEAGKLASIAHVPLEYFDPSHVAGQFAYRVASVFIGKGMSKYPATDEWYIKLMHQVVILAALQYLQHKVRLECAVSSVVFQQTDSLREIQEYVNKASERLADLQDEISTATGDDEVGQVLLAHLADGAGVA